MLIDSIDMNLLRPMRALLEERSVSRAADRLHVSQPTMSVALRRLRRYFDDPLLVREGAGHRLTPLAIQLHERVVAALRATDRVFAAQASFDPATTRREFVVYGTDFATAHLGRALGRLVESAAPHTVLRFEQITAEVVVGAPESLRECDGMFLPYGYVGECPHLDVISDRWVCLIAADNRTVGEAATAEELLSLQWVSTVDGKRALTPAGMQLRLAGAVPQVSVITPHFFVIPFFLVGTQRAALVQASFARRAVAAMAGLRMVEAPFGLEPIREAFWWHPDREDDPEHVWFRSQMCTAVDVLAAEAGCIRNPDDGHDGSSLPDDA